MERYAVIGNPVDHSLSPRIQAMFAGETAQAMSYGKLTAPVDGFDAAASGFFDGGGRGLNVTVPFKQDAWRWVTSHDSAAAASGASTPSCRRTRAFAAATPTASASSPISPPTSAGRSAAREFSCSERVARPGGVLPALFDAAPAQITLANRTESRAQEVAEAFEGLRATPLADVGGGWDVVLNATSASMAGPGSRAARTLRCGCGLLRPLLHPRCADAVLRLGGGARGASVFRWTRHVDRTGGGAFRLWRGVRPATAPVRETLRKADP